MTIHELKTWPPYFAAAKRGEKLFEVRRNDRFFQAGDQVDLVEFERTSYITKDGRSSYPDRANRLRFIVGPVLQGGQFGIEPGYCVFSLLPLPPTTPTAESMDK